MKAARISKLLESRTTTGAGTASTGIASSGTKTFQAAVTGTGAVTATVQIQVSNDATNWITMGTITLSGTTSAVDGFASIAPWAYYRPNVTAISGTGASVTVIGTEETT